MGCAMMPAPLVLTHVIERLRQARQRVASGWPSVALAMAGTPLSTAQARLAETHEARHSRGPIQPWAQVLTGAMAIVEEARGTWDTAPDHMPPLTEDLAPCGKELRLYLAPAQAYAARSIAWEDSGGLSRGQAVCVLHLAICLADWRVAGQRAEANAAHAQAEVDRGRGDRASTAAKAIWGGTPKPAKEQKERGPRSLRDLASVSTAFSDWGDEERDE